MCDCPLCPLTESNTQLCDILLRRNKTNFTIGLPDRHKNISPIIHESIARYAIYVLTSHKLEKKQTVGDSCDIDEPTYEFYMRRIMKNVWKICFHTKKVEADEDPK
jgi:hypothetical protein